MTKEDLKISLAKLNIEKSSYSLDGGFPNEAFCLDSSSGSWEVYYSERGQKTNSIRFFNEDIACNYFLGTMVYFVYLPFSKK